MADATPNEFTTLTVQLLSAFVSNNSVPSDGLAELIKSTRAALAESPASNTPEQQAPTFTPAVSVRKSLASADFILSLIDGKPYKTLKRHLTQHGLTPEQYRDRYKLPKSYPMVAPAYSEARRAVAEKLPIVVDIRLWDRTLFYCALPGSTCGNTEWARRKINAVRHFLKPSYRLFLEQGGKDQVIAPHHGLPATEYIFAGGAFPIRVQNAGVIGAVAISGLPSRQDHNTVVAVLADLLGADGASLALGAE